MITALDRVAIGAGDLAAAEAATAKLLGRSASSLGQFRLDNVTLALAANDADGLKEIGFQTANAEAAQRTLTRRGFEHLAVGDNGRIFLPVNHTYGVTTTLIERAVEALPLSAIKVEGQVTGLDHVVIRTPNPDRAAAHYGARLGLDMRLDRSSPQWGARLMFFRCGDLIVEIAHDLKAGVSDGPDLLWGLSWRVQNADTAQARLSREGFNVSDVRVGRKPGTRVFTVRDGTLGVPTLIVEPARRES
jgi:catechol 2,3-dioxygenase-like lactoylglutathione lyase family enzyme